MKTHESQGETGYKYYPIAYLTTEFATAVTDIDLDVHGTWIKPVDKTKFLCGDANNYIGNNLLAIISFGF